MSARNHIPTPPTLRWHRFCRERMPMVAFLAVLPFTLWMWGRQGRMPNAVGEVAPLRVDVASSVDGVLVPVRSAQWTLFEPVSMGQLIARLDDRLARATLDTLRHDLVRLRRDVDAESARLQLEDTLMLHAHQRENTRLTWQLLRRQLDVLDREVAIETDRVDLLRRNTLLHDFIGELETGQTIPAFDVANTKMQRDIVARRIEESDGALAEALTQKQAAAQRLLRYHAAPQTGSEEILAPLVAAVATQESRMEEVKLQIEALEIRSPISGVVVRVYTQPGQAIQAGDPIVAIASEQSEYIVTYIRQQQRLRPAISDRVVVRAQGIAGTVMRSHVEIVGPQVEPVPDHQLNNTAVPEWGLPVRIALPEDAAGRLRPGELVDLTFLRS